MTSTPITTTWHRRLLLAAACTLIAGLGSTGTAAAGPPETQKDLAAARAATARYHAASAALADGYVATGECVAIPGVGAMGEHYVNMPLLLAGTFDPARPPILLYVPGGDGPRLVGLEWAKVDADQRLDTDDDRPQLFGRPFDGPMPGHGPGDPVHFDLHVWTWAHNPLGTFAAFNPGVSCGEA